MDENSGPPHGGVNEAVAPEAPERRSRYGPVMERKGLHVSETVTRQVTLDGNVLEYRVVSGYRQGSYRVTVREGPGGRASAQIVVEADNESEAGRLATSLKNLGFSVDVDETRVRATTRSPTPHIISRAIDTIESSERKKRK